MTESARDHGVERLGAEVVSRVTMGERVMMVETGVFRASRPAETTEARSLAVKMPARCSSSSTTSTQSVRLAAHS